MAQLSDGRRNLYSPHEDIFCLGAEGRPNPSPLTNSAVPTLTRYLIGTRSTIAFAPDSVAL